MILLCSDSNNNNNIKPLSRGGPFPGCGASRYTYLHIGTQCGRSWRLSPFARTSARAQGWITWLPPGLLRWYTTHKFICQLERVSERSEMIINSICVNTADDARTLLFAFPLFLWALKSQWSHIMYNIIYNIFDLCTDWF